MSFVPEIKESNNTDQDITINDISNKKIKKIGRPKEDRNICKKCGLEKQLVFNRLTCKDCWNAKSKLYYQKNQDYAERKRANQRLKTVKIEAVVEAVVG
jgi:hypothetical protein